MRLRQEKRKNHVQNPTEQHVKTKFRRREHTLIKTLKEKQRKSHHSQFHSYERKQELYKAKTKGVRK